MYPELGDVENSDELLTLMVATENQRYIIYNNSAIEFNVLRLYTSHSFGKKDMTLKLVNRYNKPMHRHQYIRGTNAKTKDLVVLPDYYVDSTLILTTQVRMRTWVDKINTSDIKLCTFIVKTRDDFLNLCLKLILNDLDHYDLVLVPLKTYHDIHKQLPKNITPGLSTISILSILGNNSKWRRFIVDIPASIPPKDKRPMADMTWYYNSICTGRRSERAFDTINLLNDPLTSDYVQLLTIRTRLILNIPILKWECHLFLKNIETLLPECKTGKDVLEYKQNTSLPVLEEKIKDLECTKCCLDIEENIYYVTDCCFTIICTECIINKVSKVTENKCPNCNNQTNIIKFNNIDLTDITTVTLKKDPKLLNLLAIINETNEYQYDGYTNKICALKNINLGKFDVPEITGNNRRLLIVVNNKCDYNKILKEKLLLSDVILATKSCIDTLINLHIYSHIILYNFTSINDKIVGKAQTSKRNIPLKVIEYSNIY